MIRPLMLAAFAIAASLWAPGLRAQAGETRDRPVVGPIAMPAVARPGDARIADGVHLIVLPFSGSPQALVRVVIRTGADGSADCLRANVMASLLGQGSASLRGVRYTDSLAHMGGAVTVTLAPERIELSTAVLQSFVPAAVALLGSVVTHPPLDPPGVQQAARDAAQATVAAEAGVDSAAIHAFESMLFPGNEFRSECAAGDSQTASVAAMQRYYDTRVRTAPLTVYVVGRYDYGNVRRATTAAFADWRAGAPREHDQPPAAPVPSMLRIIHRPGAKQVAIVVGARGPAAGTPDFESFRIVDVLLGGGLSSRITKNIREAKGYAYGPGSTLTATPSGNAYWAESADVASNVAWPALREIVREIERLATTPPTADEVEATERYVAGRTLLARASRSGRLNEIELDDALHRGGPAAGPDAVAGAGVTPAEVQRLAAAYLSRGHLTIAIAGDTSALRTQLDSIAHIQDSAEP